MLMKLTAGIILLIAFFVSVLGDVAEQREAESVVAGRLDHLALQPRVRGRRHLPQPLRDSSGNASPFHPGGNFINVLRAPFAPIFLRQRKAAQITFVQKICK